jgi:hypothetical protein
MRGSAPRGARRGRDERGDRRASVTAAHAGTPAPALPAGALGSTPSLLTAAAFFLLPLYVMLVTSRQADEEIRLGHLSRADG